MESLIIAALHGNVEIVKIMLNDPRVVPNDKVLQYACEGGNTDIVKILLEYENMDPNSAQNYCVQIASKNGHHEIIEYLLNDRRFDKDDKNNLRYALEMAAINGHHKIVESLLKCTDITYDMNMSLIIWKCREKGYDEIVNLLSKSIV